MLNQQDVDMNWHLIAYYLRKMQLAEQNYKTHNAKLLVIVTRFNT